MENEPAVGAAGRADGALLDRRGRWREGAALLGSSDATPTVNRGMTFAALAHPWRRVAARRLERIEPSPLDPLPEVVDGGAGLRAYMQTRGHKLEIVERSQTSCTVRMALGPLGSRPVPLTVTAEEVESAGWHAHPVWHADPARFLEAVATRVAAKKVLAGQAFVADETRTMLWTTGRRRRRVRAVRRAA